MAMGARSLQSAFALAATVGLLALWLVGDGDAGSTQHGRDVPPGAGGEDGPAPTLAARALAAAAPAEPGEPAHARDTSADGGIRVVVRGVFGGAPLAGAEVVHVKVPRAIATAEDRPLLLLGRVAEMPFPDRERLVANGRGEVRVRPARGEEGHSCLGPADPGLRAIAPQRSCVTGVLWVYPWTRVDARVEVAGAPGVPREVRVRVIRTRGVECAASFPRELRPGLWERTGASNTWAFLRSGGDAVEWSAAVPRAPGQIVQACGPGFVSAWAPIDERDPHDVQRISLRLEVAPVLSGVVRNEVGESVLGAKVLVRIVVPAGADPNLDRCRMSGVGWSCWGAGGKEDPHLRFEETVSSGEQDGRFSVPLPIAGRITLFVRHAGHEPARLDLGAMEADREALVTLTRLRGPPRTHARLTRAGGTFGISGIPLELWQIEGTAVTATLRVKVDGEGRISVEGLQRGMLYLVRPAPELPAEVAAHLPEFLGKFVWNDEDEILVR